MTEGSVHLHSGRWGQVIEQHLWKVWVYHLGEGFPAGIWCLEARDTTEYCRVKTAPDCGDQM